MSLWIVNLYLQSYTFLPLFYPTVYLRVWIQIRIPNTDPDPESPWIQIQYWSGSTTLFKSLNHCLWIICFEMIKITLFRPKFVKTLLKMWQFRLGNSRSRSPPALASLLGDNVNLHFSLFKFLMGQERVFRSIKIFKTITFTCKFL